jgi:transcriptional regulator with XRE-family HTH domain
MTITRDQEICDHYRSGLTQRELANRYQLSISWIGQILKREGLNIGDRAKRSRPTFTGVLLSPSVKAIVRTISKVEETSMSAWIADLIEKELKSRGVTFPQLEEDVELPYEAPDSDV